MHIDHGFLSTCFGLTLFLLLVLKIKSLVVEHFIPFLKEYKNTLKKTYATLIDKKKLLVARTSQLEQEIQSQDIELALLRKKIGQWHDHIRTQDQERLKNNALYLENLTKKRVLQSKQLSMIKQAQEIIPQAIDQTTTLLANKYAGNQGSEHIKKMISSLRKSS